MSLRAGTLRKVSPVNSGHRPQVERWIRNFNEGEPSPLDPQTVCHQYTRVRDVMEEMASAHYSVVVPKVDGIGNPIGVDIAGAAHHYLAFQRPFRSHRAWIDAAQRGNYPHEIVHAHADDTPEADSHMKQIAHYIGELVNHPSIPVSKSGKQGVSHWDIANRLFQPGQPSMYASRPPDMYAPPEPAQQGSEPVTAPATHPADAFEEGV